MWKPSDRWGCRVTKEGTLPTSKGVELAVALEGSLWGAHRRTCKVQRWQSQLLTATVSKNPPSPPSSLPLGPLHSRWGEEEKCKAGEKWAAIPPPRWRVKQKHDSTRGRKVIQHDTNSEFDYYIGLANSLLNWGHDYDTSDCRVFFPLEWSVNKPSPDFNPEFETGASSAK